MIRTSANNWLFNHLSISKMTLANRKVLIWMNFSEFAKKYKTPESLDFTGFSGEVFGVPEVIRTPDLPLRRSPRGAFLTPSKSPKILDFTGFSEVALLVNSRPKPANFSWFFSFLLAGY